MFIHHYLATIRNGTTVKNLSRQKGSLSIPFPTYDIVTFKGVFEKQILNHPPHTLHNSVTDITFGAAPPACPKHSDELQTRGVGTEKVYQGRTPDQDE